VITVRRANERRHLRRGKQEIWRTFYRHTPTDALAEGFGALEVLDEDLLPPGAGVLLHPHHDAEVVLYVLDGALAYEDSTGRSGVVRAGGFQRMTAGRGIRQSETNESRTASAHVFRTWLRASEPGLEPIADEEERSFVADRRGALCVVASPNGRRGSLRIHEDALVLSAVLDEGKVVTHELVPGRSVWLHVVGGRVMLSGVLSGVVLAAGDGIGVTGGRKLSIAALAASEILVLDVVEPPSRSENNGGLR
jgi:quercetin 2,3-dioxygenase